MRFSYGLPSQVNGKGPQSSWMSMDISVNGAPQESIQRQYRGKNPQRHIGRPDATNGQWVVYIEAMGLYPPQLELHHCRQLGILILVFC